MKIPLYFDFINNSNWDYTKLNAIDNNDKTLFYVGDEDYASDHNFCFSFNLEENNLVHFVNNSYNEKFFYPIYLSFKWFNIDLQLIREKILIPDIIINKIKSGQAKILVSNIYEGFQIELFDEIIITIKEKYHLSNNDFVLMSGNLIKNTINSIPNVYFNYWEYYIYDEYNKQNKNISLKKKIYKSLLSNEEKQFKFLCLNRRPRVQRLALFTEMYKNRSEGILSMGVGDYPVDIQQIGLVIEELQSIYPNTYKKFIGNKLKTKIPFEYDVSLSNENPAFDPKYEKYIQSYFSIISETYFENHTTRMFFSEKIFKPIVFMQPFILFGQYRSLHTLRSLGYKTFSPFINEDYDNIENDQQRFYSALSSSKILLQKSKKELSKMTKNMLPILSHNLNILKNRKENMHFEIIKKLNSLLK